MRLKLLVAVLGAVFVLISGFRPGALPYTPGQPFSDAVTSHLPAAQFLRRSVLEAGAFPVWRETIMAGQPFAADPLNKTAYPLQWLALLLPAELHLDVMILLHLLIAGAGMWTWARALGLRESAAALSALAYALAPRLIGHTGAGHLDLLYALAWFPWWMWAVGNLLDVGARLRVRPEHEGRHTGLPLREMLLVGLFGGLILLADVRVSLFAYLLAGAYALYEAIRLKRAARLGWFVPAGIVIGLLTLSLIAPLLAWRPYLSRAGLSPADAGVFSLKPGQLIGLLLPAWGGNIESLTYVGLPVLALAIIGGITARRWFWLGAAGVAVWWTLGQNGILWSTLVRIVPALLWFRVPSRAWFVVALIAPLLAGYGLEWLLDQRRRGLLAALIGTVIAVAGGIFFMLSVPVINGLALMVGGGGFGLVALLAFSGRLRGDRLVLAVIVVTFLDLAISGRGWLEWRTQESWLPPNQVALAARLNQLDAYRVYSPSYSLQQQVAEDYHLRLFGGVDPFQLNGLVEAVDLGGGVKNAGSYDVTLPPLNTADLTQANRDAVPDAAVLARWGVTHVVSAYPLDVPNLAQVDVIDGAYIYANRDPALKTNFGSPAWPDGAPDLPDRAAVQLLNRVTEAAALISGAALIVVLALLTKVRR